MPLRLTRRATELGVGPGPSQLLGQRHPRSLPQAGETPHFQRHGREPEEWEWQGQVGDGNGPQAPLDWC